MAAHIFKRYGLLKNSFYCSILLLSLLLTIPTNLSAQSKAKGEDKISRIDTLLSQATVLSKQLDSNSLALFDEAFRLSSEISYTSGQITALNRKGIYYFSKSNLDLAEENYLKAIEIATKAKDSSEIIKLNGNLALVETYRGNYAGAMEIQLKVVDYYERKHPERLGGKLVDLAIIYYYLGQEDKLISTLKAGLENAEKHNDYSVIGTATNNLGIFLKNMGKLQEAEIYYRKALALTREQGNKLLEIQCLMNVASVIEDLELSMVEMKKALVIAEEVGAIEQEADLLINIGVIHTNMDEYKKATSYFRRALTLYEGLKMPNKEMQAAVKLANNLERIGEYKEAIKYWETHFILKDSIYKMDMVEKVAELETKYETQKKEAELVQKNLEIEKNNVSIAHKNRIILYLITVFIAILFIGLFFYQRYRNKQKLKIQEAVLVEKEKGFKSVLLAQEEERQRIAGELHDSVGQQLNVFRMEFGNLVKDTSDNSLSNEAEKLYASLDKSIEEVRVISHQMMPKALIENGLVDALRDLMDNVSSVSGIDFVFEHYNPTEKLPKEIEVSLYRICQELIHNVLKHAQASQAHVFLHKGPSSVSLIIEDNGKGIEKTKTDGIGVVNIKKRIELLRGKFSIQPGELSGTFVNVQIPLKEEA